VTDFERLASGWRDQGVRADRDPDRELANVKERAMKLERQIRLRDRLEAGAAMVALPAFIWAAIETPYPISRTGALLIAVACIVIPIRLRLARRPPPDPAAPIATSLRAELVRVRAQEQLLKTVGWWYVGPLAVGLLLLVNGAGAPGWFEIGFSGGATAFLIAVYRANRRVVDQKLVPQANQLESWIASLEDSPEAAVVPGRPKDIV
jgi:hypothetical protein